MATKTVNDFTRDCDAKRGVPSFAAIIEACATTNNPAEADLTYRDLRLSGLTVPAEVYVDLIRVHARAGNLIKAVNYFYKHNDLTVTTTTTTPAANDSNSTATRYDTFKPSKSMNLALIQAYFVNAELDAGFRVLRQTVQDFGPIENVITTVGKYLDNVLDEYSQNESLNVWKNRETFKDTVYLFVADGFLQIANSHDSTVFSFANDNSAVDKEHCRVIGLELTDYLMNASAKYIQGDNSDIVKNAKTATSTDSKHTSTTEKPQLTNTYRKSLSAKNALKNHQLIYKRAAAFALQTYTSASTVQTAKSIIPSTIAILEQSKKYNLMSLQIVQSYLDTIATAVVHEIIVVDEGVAQWVKVVDPREYWIAKMDGIVVVQGGKTMEDVVREWCEGGGIVGGVKKNEAALKLFVDKCGIRQTVIEI